MTTACTVCELHAESTFKVEGMDCREEVALLERRFKNLVGLEDFSADLMGRRLHVKYDAAKLSASAIAGAVADTGMRAWLEHEEPLASSEPNNRRRQALVWTSGLALAAGLVTQAISAGGSAEAVLGWCLPDVAAVGAGQSEVNQAPVTGESLPVDKAPGDGVFAGTINGRGALDVRVTRLRRDTTLARIIHIVERAQAERAPSQTLVERFARVYTPAVIVLAAAIAVIPPLALHLAWHDWIYRALVLLVVSCPCALVISTPVSIVAALAGAARKGVLIKGGRHLERTARVQCIAFDKTGTLTRGTPQVVDVIALNGAPPASIIGLAAAIEHRSTHPVARAILEHAGQSHVASLPAAGVIAI